MIFTSFAFLVLLLVVLSLYYILPFRAQNVLLLIASYIFYGWWDWRFLGLLFFSTILDYFIGLALDRYSSQKIRKSIIVFSITIQLILLGFFKYYNFFVESFATLMEQFGIPVYLPLLSVILPVGISFYTFHTISYTVDIYRRLSKPTTDFIGFALFISFFPQLVAGPIARASHLLPQCLARRKPTRSLFFEGCYFFYWGLFKKVVVADNLSVIVDQAFNQPGQLNAFSALLGVYAFAWQIYCDFSGYTDMARGCSKLMGFELQVNFNVPYLAVDPSDFWKRWHISLSTWLRDYLYIPLGGNRGSAGRVYFNLMVTMLLGGLWHGASWTFVLWGFFHGLLLIVYRVLCPTLAKDLKPGLKKIFHQVFFFHLVCISWLLFRAQNYSELTAYMAGFLRQPILDKTMLVKVCYALPVFVLEYFVYKSGKQNWFLEFPVWIRVIVYFGIYWALMSLGKWAGEGFIYFQF